MGLLTGKKVRIIGFRHDLGPALHKAIKEAGATNAFSLNNMNFPDITLADPFLDSL
jgi:serine protease inhibitor